MTPREAAHIIYDYACGTPQDIVASIDTLIDDGDINQEFFRSNELDILNIVDDLMFTCEVCGWIVGRSDESDTPSICVDCGDDHDDD